jgi:hypothetical protein
VAYGMAVMWDYQYGAGSPARPPAHWPSDTRLERVPDRPTLVMLLHPQCPCSRASIGELARLMARLEGRLTARLLFLKPAGTPDGWEDTDLWQSAAVIPGVTVLADADGAEARRFGALTSGQVVVYDAGGRLLWNGGITPSRGHAGDNEGRDTIVALLAGERMEARPTPVFGCSLVTPTS